MQVKLKKLNKNAIIPSSGSKQAAGYDLHACIEKAVIIEPGECVKVGTGLSIAVPEGYFGAVFARSGLASKNGIRPANCVGVCDSDYRGEYIIPLRNDSEFTFTVNPGDRIAQLIILPYLSVDFIETDSLDSTERGEKGFGSTGL